MNSNDNPYVNRQYLLDLTKRHSMELAEKLSVFLPETETIDCNELTKLLRNICYSLQSKGVDTMVLRTHLTDTQDGRLWFNVFTNQVIPFLATHLEALNG